ncbi:MAG: alpha/beta hydrolase [Gammaproteobacteria bacterium]|nr:alpha/beta hydrolase [Gammaproteobacteria bacterium]
MDTINNLRILDIKPDTETQVIVIWLHGLGANASDFEPVLPILNEVITGIRYIFPNAPLKSVSVNGGMMMPAWYDISNPDLSQHQDLDGIEESCCNLEGLVTHIRNEAEDNTPIILAGFSQGGVIALTTALTKDVDIQGVLALSTYLPELKQHDITNKLDLSLLMMHGTSDPVIPIGFAKKSFEKLATLISDTNWEEFPMDHSLCYEEVIKIGEWLKTIANK